MSNAAWAMLLTAALSADPSDTERGRFLVEERNCFACHRPDDKDHFAAGLTGRQGPDLSKAGERLHAGWIYRWLEAPDKIRPGTVMPRLFADDAMGRTERYAVTSYLASLGRLGAFRRERQRGSWAPAICTHRLLRLSRRQPVGLGQQNYSRATRRLPARSARHRSQRPNAEYAAHQRRSRRPGSLSLSRWGRDEIAEGAGRRTDHQRVPACRGCGRRIGGLSETDAGGAVDRSRPAHRDRSRLQQLSHHRAGRQAVRIGAGFGFLR